MKKLVLVAILAVTVLPVESIGMAYCALKSFDDACSNCGFDGEGRIDKACQDGFQSSGRNCVIKAYPRAAAKYLTGFLAGDGCPALEKCIDMLKMCDKTVCLGKARDDCQSPVCRNCYAQADRCAFMASKDCADEARCGDGECNVDKGENMETCCRDCGCGDKFTCVENNCVQEKEEDSDGPELDDVYVVDLENPSWGDFLMGLCLGVIVLPFYAVGLAVFNFR